MGNIRINTEVNAPCPCEIVHVESGKSILAQVDTDYPGFAAAFGWSVGHVPGIACNHSGTDGTVECPNCGMPASTFIESAREFLEENNGKIADDPGYFG